MESPRNLAQIGINDRSEYHDSIDRFCRDDETPRVQKLEAGASILEAIRHNSQYLGPQTGSTTSLRAELNSTSPSASTSSRRAIYNPSQASNRSASVSRSVASSPETTSSLPALIPSRPSIGESSRSSSFSSSHSIDQPTYMLPFDEVPRIDGLRVRTDDGERLVHEHIYPCPFHWLECYNREREELQNLVKSIQHFRGKPPPTIAICLFCDNTFRHADGNTCWEQLMEHMAHHHRNGANFAYSRPDLHLIWYMRENGLVGEAFYRKVIARYTTEILPGEPLYAGPEIVERPVGRGPERPAYVPQSVRRADIRRRRTAGRM
ncbi:MAG: hypothetical protein M1824_000506 [Vezdaea acicularis]|nr:MAG: hypothetical protein M1824_000506 [Vezdaea acicularis]